ncbi:MAG: chemotaxis protein CheA [Pseudomonadota bacterium]
MDPLAELRETFFLECDELLEQLESDLMELEAGSEDLELINSAFRAVHSIKGGAGAFGMTAITETAHVFETLMDHLRSETLELNPDLCALLLRGKDLLTSTIDVERGGDPVDEVEAAAVLEAFEQACPDDGEDEEDAAAIFQPVGIDLDLPDDGEDVSDEDFLAAFVSDDDDGDEGAAPGGGEDTLQVTFKPLDIFYGRGNDPGPFLKELCSLGEASVTCDTSRLPTFDELDPTAAYFFWNVALSGGVDRMDVDDIFDFVGEDCDNTITEGGAATADDASGEPAEAGEALTLDIENDEAELEDVALADADLEALQITEEPEASTENDDAAAGAEDEVVPLEPSTDEAPAAQGEPVAASPEPEPAPKAEAPKQSAEKTPAKSSGPKPVVRVELSRVDRLINLVSELVISQSMLSQAVEDQQGAGASSLSSGLDEFRQLTRELQESVMAIRAEPVKSLFMRMSQIVRSTAASTGKKVKLVTEGDTTEVDKTVIERLAEPLTHMIRNAIDHGVEAPEKRLEAGKEETGTVHLSAEHHSGRVVLTVKDDGGGVNREKVREIAIRKGIIPEDAILSESETDALLFAPGFSTADTVSQVSGRGVGMDVVKREINALGGRITISSVPGEGSTFTISLPLTLAVLDGMVIRVADQTAVLPLSVIAESLRPEPSDIQNLGGEDQVVFVRGNFVPILDVGAALGYRAPLETFEGSVMLLVESDTGSEYAFAVDEIVDQRQVVIKGLQANYGRIKGVAAATILGDGQIALILDVNDLAQDHSAVGVPVPVAENIQEAANV